MVTEEGEAAQAPSFADRLRNRTREIHSWLCIGLDPDPAWLPPHIPRTPGGVTAFCREIIDATRQYAACYKINFAFFEALGPDGWRALADVRTAIPEGVPCLADAKRGDIGSTDAAYARAILDVLDFDALTVSPYLGRDSVEPFLSYPGKGVFVLCKTSNPGAADFQDLEMAGEPLYLQVARRVLSWDGQGEAGLVVGATQPDALARVRALSEDVLLLMPGVGAQGASPEDAMRLGANRAGENALCAVSRHILCASSGTDFAHAAGLAAQALARKTWRSDAAG